MRRFCVFSSAPESFRQPMFTTGKLCLNVAVGVCMLNSALAQVADPAKILAEQKEKALYHWKRGVGEDLPLHHETKHLLIYSNVPGVKLKDLTENLEKQFEAAAKVLEVKKGDLWPGKLAVYLIATRSKFSKFVRRAEVRRVYSNERGSVKIRTEHPHAVAGPPENATGLSVTEQAGAQIGIAILSKKHARGIPSWVKEGFGRATALATANEARKQAEQQTLVDLVNNKKRKLTDAWSPAIPYEEAGPIRGSVIGFLAYSGRTDKFLPFLKGFRPSENSREPSTEDAFRAAVVDIPFFHRVWLKHVRGEN